MRQRMMAMALAGAAGLALSASVQAQVIQNGGFETGSFAPWVQFGDTSFTAVETFLVHSGTYGGEFGPLSPGGIQQALTANAGDNLVIDFWYQAQGSSNSFSVALDSNVLYSVTNDTTHTSWSHLTFGAVAANANPTLILTFTNPPSYDYLDDVNVSIGILGACCLPNYTCSLLTATDCGTAGGVYHSGQTCAQANCPPPPTGACCTTSGCSIVTQSACAAASGTYGGDNSACTQAFCPTGACCLDTGCTQMTQVGCTGASGTFAGSGIACGAAGCAAATAYVEGPTDAGNLPNTAAVPPALGTPLLQIRGNYDTGDSDMYQINVCDPANFSATTVGGTTLDTMLMLFKADGTGVTFDDDDPAGTTLQSRITNQFVSSLPAGKYYLAASRYTLLPQGSLGPIWIDDNTAGHEFRVERQPEPGHESDPIIGWNTSATTGGPYTIFLTGTCFPAPSCYANCDNSTNPPILNANDFQCFLNKYAANDPYANCDHSTNPPILNANDFQCFLNAYAAGCN